jgi:lipoprotein-releasing system permease protein
MIFPELFLARRYLLRGKSRHISFIGIVSCLGIALGVATLIIVISVMNGFDRDLTEKLMRFNYHLTVEATTPELLQEVQETVGKWGGVTAASRFVQTQIFIKFDDTVLPLVVKGIDFDDVNETAIFYQYVSHDFADKGFFAGSGLRRRFFGQDSFKYYPLNERPRLQQGSLRGFFKVGLYDIDNSYLITSLAEARNLSENYLLFLGVRLSEPYAAQQIKEKIRGSFPADVFATTWMESNEVLFSALALEKLVMFVILSLIILVASFNIFVALTVGVIEKTKDIGILKTLGFTRRRVLGIFSLQGLVLGVFGTGLGTGLGLGLSILLKEYQFIQLPQEIYYIEYLPVAINYRDIAIIMLVGFLLSYIFSIFPAMRAARLTPSKALRYE